MPDRRDRPGNRVKCSRCGFSNLESHKFCANCGARLARPAPTHDPEGRTKAQKLIEDAFREFERENLGEAILLGEAAVALDPSSASAHSLLGTVYDKRGQVSEAIRCFEKAVELNPDSPADRERLESLRLQSVAMTTSAAKVSAARNFLEKNASLILVAVATALVVFLIMLPIMLLRGRGAGTSGTPPGQVVRGMPSGARPVAPPPSRPSATSQPAGAAGPTQAVSPAPQRTTGQGAAPYRSVPGGSASTAGLPPILSAEPLAVPAGMSLPGQAGGAQAEGGTRPAREQAPSITLTLNEAEPSRAVQGGGSPAAGGASGAAPGLDLWALGNRARTFQGSGMYREAVENYSRLMDAAPSGRIAQQLGICYQRLGSPEKAREAYSRAIDLFNEDVSEGRSPEEARQGIRSCEMGLRTLGGG